MSYENFLELEYNKVPKHLLIAYSICKIASIEQLVVHPSNVVNKEETPMVLWRYSEELSTIINKLKNCVLNFKGNLEWEFFQYRNNYIIEPKFFKELFNNVGKDKYVEIVKNLYVDIYYKAIDDIPKLSEAIEECFNLKDKKPKMPKILN